MEISIKSLQFEEEIKSATVTYIYVKEGEPVKKGQDIIELATSKSVFVAPSPIDGTVRKIGVQEADTVDENKVLMVIE